MYIFKNFDLFLVGLSVANIIFLGFIVYFNDRKSITNRSFLGFAISSSLWGLINYASYHITFSPTLALWSLRFVLFFALAQVFFLHRLFSVFPYKKYNFGKKYKYIIVPLTIIAALLTLTPLIFERVMEFSYDSGIETVASGPAIPFFAFVSIGLVFLALSVLIKKIRLSRDGKNKRALVIILAGTLATFILEIIFNFILPAFLYNSNFVALGSIFALPFIACASYAIIKHGVMNVKVLTTEILIFSFAAAILFDVVGAGNSIMLFYRLGVFVIILLIGIFLIKTMRKEVKQRETLVVMAKNLKKANRRLREMDQLKTEFLSIASHQLRTPLSIIKGYIDLIREGTFNKSPKKFAEVLNNMDESNEKLIKLVDEFLDISRIEQQRSKFKFQKININDLINEVVKQLRKNVKDKKLKLEVNMPKNKIMASIDRHKIFHVIYNYIDNAIKYSDKGTIRVDLSRENNKIRISVTDQGVGFDKKNGGMFFVKYYRGKNVKGINVTGTGLGLYVSKKFVQGHGGEVWAKSKGLGKGSEFGFSLPLKR